MSYDLFIQSEAIIDIQEAFEWYEAKRRGLGFELIEEIENGYDKICKNPQYYTSITKKFRRLKVNRFPYLIIYEIEKNSVIVNSVKHSRSKSKF